MKEWNKTNIILTIKFKNTAALIPNQCTVLFLLPAINLLFFIMMFYRTLAAPEFSISDLYPSPSFTIQHAFLDDLFGSFPIAALPRSCDIKNQIYKTFSLGQMPNRNSTRLRLGQYINLLFSLILGLDQT